MINECLLSHRPSQEWSINVAGHRTLLHFIFESFVVFLIIVYHKLRKPFIQLGELVLIWCLIIKLHIHHLSMRSTSLKRLRGSPVLKCKSVSRGSQKAIRFWHLYFNALLLLFIYYYLKWKVCCLAHCSKISFDFPRYL